MTYLQTLGLFNRNIRLYLVSAFTIGFSYFGIFIVLFNLYLLRLGYSPRFIGAISALGSFAFVVMSMPAGALGRRFGSRPVIIGGILLYFLGFTLLPLAEFVPPAFQTAWLSVTYLIAFLGGPLYWVNSSIYMMGMTGKEERNHVFSVRAALLPFAGFIGGLFAGFLTLRISLILGISLDNPAPYRYTLLLGGLLYALPLWAMIRADNSEHDQEEKTSPPWKLMPLALVIPLALVEMLRMAGEVGTQTFINVYFDVALDVNPVRISMVLAAASLVAGLATLTMPGMVKRWGNDRTVLITMVGSIFFLLPLALIPNWIVAALCYVIFLTFSNISRSTALVYRMEIVIPIWWVSMASFAVTAQGIGQSASLYGSGLIIEQLGFPTFFLAMASVIFIGMIIFWTFNTLHKKQPVSGMVGLGE